MNLEKFGVYKSGVVIKPTTLPARKRNTDFAIPNNTYLRLGHN